MIAAVATACLVFAIIYHGLNKSKILEQFKYPNKKIVAQTNEKRQPDFKDASPAPQEKIKTGPPSAKPSEYSSRGKIDPFESLFREKPVVALPKKKGSKRSPRTPLEKLDLSQLKLVGIILSSDGNKALVEDSTGKGYTLFKGTYIGINSGKVVEIRKDKIIIEEQAEDAMGYLTIQRKELVLNK
jgi:type IV pilus assembly protein PilP